MRQVTINDFITTRTIRAQYNGNSPYLVKGHWYNIRFMEKRNKVSVPFCDNPQLGKTNGGMEFGLRQFLVEE